MRITIVVLMLCSVLMGMSCISRQLSTDADMEARFLDMMKDIPGGSSFVVLMDVKAVGDVGFYSSEEMDDMEQDKMWGELGIPFEQVDTIALASYAGPMYIYGDFQVGSVGEHLTSSGYERIGREDFEIWSNGIYWIAIMVDYVVMGDQLVPPDVFPFVKEGDMSLHDYENVQATVKGLRGCPYIMLVHGADATVSEGPMVVGMAVCGGGGESKSKVLAGYESTDAAEAGMEEIASNLEGLKDDNPDMEMEITVEGTFVRVEATGDVESFWQSVFSEAEQAASD